MTSGDCEFLSKLCTSTRVMYSVSGSKPSSTKTSESSELFGDLPTLSDTIWRRQSSFAKPFRYKILVLLITWLSPGCHDNLTLLCWISLTTGSVGTSGSETQQHSSALTSDLQCLRLLQSQFHVLSHIQPETRWSVQHILLLENKRHKWP